jgi:macrolide-specific efflux system membrane fusion protein
MGKKRLMRKRSWMWVAVAVAILAGLLLLHRSRAGNSSRSELETYIVGRGDIETKVLSTGTIQPYTRVEVNSSVNGRVDKIEVEEGHKVGEGDVLAWISSEERIVLLDAARSKLLSAKRDGSEQAIQEAERAYEIAERAYKAVPLTNSISGEVIARSCERGQNVSTQDVLFVISDRLVANVEVDEVDVGKIKTGQSAVISLDAFPDEQVESRVAKISREGTLESDVVVYDVMVEPLRIPGQWASGMTANVEFLIERSENTLLIPRNALREKDGRKFVVVLRGEPVLRFVETGVSDGTTVEILRGLEEGEELVLQNQDDASGEADAMRPPMPMMLGRR